MAFELFKSVLLTAEGARRERPRCALAHTQSLTSMKCSKANAAVSVLMFRFK